MSVIYTGEYYKSTHEYELLCEVCKASVGRATRAECSGLSVSGARVLCFDCDGFVADLEPPQLIPEDGEEIFIYDEQLSTYVAFSIDKNAKKTDDIFRVRKVTCSSAQVG